MSVQPQSMRLYFNRIQSQGGLPSAYNGTTPGSKWLLRKKGITLSSCIPQLDGGSAEIGNKKSIATNGTVDAVLSTVSRSGRTKPDLDIAQLFEGSYIRLATPDLSAILADSFSYTSPIVAHDSINNEFVVLLQRNVTGSPLFVLRVSDSAYTVVGGSPDTDSGGLLWPVTRTGNFGFGGLSGAFVGYSEKGGVPYMMFACGNAGYVASLNLTTRAATTVSMSAVHPGAGFSANPVFGGSRGTDSTGRVVAPVTGPASSTKLVYLSFDPSGATPTTKVEIMNTNFAGSSTSFTRIMNTAQRVMTDTGREIFLSVCNIVSAGVQTRWMFAFDQTAYAGKVALPNILLGTIFNTEPGEFIYLTPILGQASQRWAAKYTFNPANNTFTQAFFNNISPANLPTNPTSTSGQHYVYRADGGYIADCHIDSGATRPIMLISPTTGVEMTTTPVATSIGSVGSLVAADDLALHAAYPAMYIPEEGSDLDPVSCSVLISNFVGGAFDGTLPDKNFLVNIASDSAEDSNGKGLSKVISTVTVNAMNSTCVLSGPGTVVNLENVREEA